MKSGLAKKTMVRKVVMVPKVLFVVYEGRYEVIVTTPEREAETLKAFFGIVNGKVKDGEFVGRDIDFYDRHEMTEPCGFLISARLKVS